VDIDVNFDVEVEGKVKLRTIDWMAGLKCNKINSRDLKTTGKGLEIMM
jgi:hypothetical protein